MIDKWKLILQDVQKSCNHASPRCQEMQLKVEESVSAVKAADEYKKFTEINKTTPPAPVNFKFDETLLAGGTAVENIFLVNFQDLYSFKEEGKRFDFLFFQDSKLLNLLRVQLHWTISQLTA